MRARTTFVTLVIFALLFAGVYTAFAQISTAQLNGTVRDQSGGAVAKASLALREMDTNQTYTANATETGSYMLPNVTPGRYELKVSFTGFANFTQTGIVLTVGQSATIDVTLNVAGQGEQMVVTTEAPVIEPTKTEISQVIQPHQIQNLCPSAVACSRISPF